ncbi:tRNA pseudouridine(55) synthase TruB [Woodsholea maritima]|uniref:tRNA pseudouridine(55) synthase TruB n=1 Tax=Woodsholea maritima TaxID=240237 RepID=UPI0003798D64|nr:tRNA pseudouridine(55) synthase TruB [Woodsholea maritima]
MGRRKTRGIPVHGWVVFDKPLEMTSTQAVAKIRYLFNAQKAGHAGTLDPLASGILPIALGEATKTVPFAQDGTKTYRFTVRWGRSTTTLDGEGASTGESDVRPSQGEIEAVIPRFIGEIDQVPPAFSAIWVNGERAYDLARAGHEVELKARKIQVDDLRLMDCPNADLAVFEMVCGKGSYVRSMARDLAMALGAEGHVAALRRTQVGPFTLDGAVTLDALADLGHKDQLYEALKPVETALDDIPALALTQDEVAHVRQGRAIVLPARRADELRALRRPRMIGDKDFSRAAVAFFEGRAVAIGLARAGQFAPVRVFQID